MEKDGEKTVVPQFVACVHMALVLKMEATCSSETSAAEYQRTTRRYIMDDRSPNSHRCDNLKCYIIPSKFL
jgi:hypothetical protein